MEVPSSSPVYTPLRARKQPSIDTIEPVTLDFESGGPIDSSSDDDDDAPPPSSFDASPLKSTRSMAILRQVGEVEDSQTWDKPLNIPHKPQKKSSPHKPSRKRRRSSAQDTLETIDSGTDTDQEDLGKLTQNYFDELLTDSILESLPLPPQKRREVAHIYDRSVYTST